MSTSLHLDKMIFAIEKVIKNYQNRKIDQLEICLTQIDKWDEKKKKSNYPEYYEHAINILKKEIKIIEKK